MLNKTAWLSLLLAAALGGGVYVYELVRLRQEPSSQSLTRSQQWFQLQETDIQKIVIESFPDRETLTEDSNEKTTLELVKTDAATNSWQLKQPQDVAANDGTVVFLLNLIANGKPQRTFDIASNNLSQYGLERPIAKITFIAGDRSEQIILGSSGIDRETIYARIKTPTTDPTDRILSVPRNWQYAVEGELVVCQLINEKSTNYN